MTSIIKRALAITHSTNALHVIVGCSDLRTAQAREEAARFVARAPADRDQHDRYTATESLCGCIRNLQRGKNGIRKLSLVHGLNIASEVLTFAYVQARTGFGVERDQKGRSKWAIEEFPRYEREMRGHARGPTVETAIAVMVEASRFLRHGLAMVRAGGEWLEVNDRVPPAESMAYLGIGGESMDDHAIGEIDYKWESERHPIPSGHTNPSWGFYG